MKETTKIMIRQFKIMKLGCDFMGYNVHRKESLTFHHLIIPARNGGKVEISNGAILDGKTSHPYLHLIEATDREIFERITQQMIEENRNGRIDIEHLKVIRDLLLYFEKEHKGDTTRKGKILIKREFINERIEI